MTVPSTIQPVASWRSSAHTRTAPRTRTRPGSTGTTTPTRPSRITSPTTTSRPVTACRRPGHDRPRRSAPGPVGASSEARSALVLGRDGGGFAQPFALVGDGRRGGRQGARVLAAVVGAEQQLPAAQEHDTDVGLGPAAVAAVGCGELGGGESTGHVTFLFHFRDNGGAGYFRRRRPA